MKSILAPMFASRNLNVMSWVGHNIFGNLDGKVLDDPVNKANKVHSTTNPKMATKAPIKTNKNKPFNCSKVSGR